MQVSEGVPVRINETIFIELSRIYKTTNIAILTVSI
jgi:hypothetical protein